MDARTALLQRTRARHALPPPERRRQIREEAGASIADVAGVLGVTPQAVWAWETDRAHPNASNLVAYVRLLDDLVKATAA